MPQAIDEHTTSTRRAVFHFGRAALITSLAVPTSVAATPAADAELMALCKRLVMIENKITALMATRNTIEDEGRTEPQLAAMFTDEERVLERIYDQPNVTTIAGALAMARASIAVAPRGADGQIVWIGHSEYLAWSVAEFLVGRAVG